MRIFEHMFFNRRTQLEKNIFLHILLTKLKFDVEFLIKSKFQSILEIIRIKYGKPCWDKMIDRKKNSDKDCSLLDFTGRGLKRRIKKQVHHAKPISLRSMISRACSRLYFKIATRVLGATSLT